MNGNKSLQTEGKRSDLDPKLGYFRFFANNLFRLIFQSINAAELKVARTKL